MLPTETFLLTIPMSSAGKRLDVVLAELLPSFSRNKIQDAIRSDQATVNGKKPKLKDKVYGGESIQITISLEQDFLNNAKPQDIPLNIIYEDDDIIVINKPAGLVVHPAAGNPDGTLLNALLSHNPNAHLLPRAGIVHRLDKDTSGLMVVAKTLDAYYHLTEQLADHSMGRTYHAIANGEIISGQTIDIPIGRHKTDRKKMSAQAIGKSAITHVRVLEHFRGHTFIECKLETGRTHQIRVHMSHIHHPLFGDATYGGRLRLPQKMEEEQIEILRSFKRQALHAKKLSLIHPTSGEALTFESEYPEDFEQLLYAFKKDIEQNWTQTS